MMSVIHEIGDDSIDIILQNLDYGFGMDYGNKIISCKPC